MDNGMTSIREVGGATIVDVHKDMDFLTAKEVKDAFIRLMNSGHRCVVGNLLQVRLVDSSGLEALASAQIKARSLDVRFGIILSNSSIRRLLATTGLDEFLTIYATEQDALSDIAQGA
ncbi:MAG: STAS domain-containing protein [Candidatus Xenobia bacterium]